MYNITDLKIGTTIKFREHAVVIIYSEHSKLGRGGGIMRTKIRDLESGAILEHTFKDNDKIEELELNRKVAQYLYADGESYCFMDPETFEQFTLSKTILGNSANYLQEGKNFTILYAEDKPLNIELPIKMDFRIAEAEPGIKGNTVSGGTKMAVLENGIKVQVPLFIKSGDKIRIDTRTGRYIERA